MKGKWRCGRPRPIARLPVAQDRRRRRPDLKAASAVKNTVRAEGQPRLTARPKEPKTEQRATEECKRRRLRDCRFHIRDGRGSDVGVVESERRGLGYQGRAWGSHQRTTGVEIGHEASGQSRQAEGS